MPLSKKCKAEIILILAKRSYGMTNISSYEITKISKKLMPESTLPFLGNEGGEKIYEILYFY